jgi:hypothetical protein
MRRSEMVLFALLGFKIVLIFFLAKENGTKRKRPRHEPFGFACASMPRSDAPELAPPLAGLRQPPRLYRSQQRCSAS